MGIKTFISKFSFWGKERVKRLDIFSKPITLTYKSSDSFTTLFGGIVSISIFTLLIIYAVTLGLVLVNRKGTQKSKSSTRKNISSDPETYVMTRDNLGFAFIFRENMNNWYLDRTYLDVQIHQSSINIQNVSSIVYSSKNRPYQKWGNTLPNIAENEPIVQQLKYLAYCPVNQTFEVDGSVYGMDMKYVQILVKRCVNGTDVVWKTPQEIEDKIKASDFLFGFANKYFDLADYENPIKSYIEYKYTYSLVSGFHKSATLYVKKSEAELDDELLQISNTQQIEFLSIDNFLYDFSAEKSDQTLLSLIIRQDSSIDYYERRVYSLLDLTGQVGGLFEVFQAIGSLTVGFFAHKLLLYSFFNKLYHVESKDIGDKLSEPTPMKIMPKTNNQPMVGKQNSMKKKIENKSTNGDAMSKFSKKSLRLNSDYK